MAILISEHTSVQKIVKLLEWINVKQKKGYTEINILITDWPKSVIECSQEGKPFKLNHFHISSPCKGQWVYPYVLLQP